MPRQSVFVFEINNKEDEIETEVLNTFRKLKVDTSIPLPWEGFLVKHETNLIAHEKDEQEVHRFIYVFEEEQDFTSLTGETIKNRIVNRISIWVDPDAKLISIFTSDSGKAFNILRKIITLKNNNLNVTPIKFEIDFLKWLENIKDYQKGNLTDIIGTRATNLSERSGISSNLSLTTNKTLNQSEVFALIKNKGSREYLKGIFTINSVEIEASFYTNCKLTVSKKKSKISLDELKHSIKIVYAELKKWHNKYKKEISP